MLDELPTLEGTGFDYDDYSEVKDGKPATPKEPKVKFKIGEYGFSATESIYAEWREGVDLPTEALHRLGIPLTAVIHTE